VKGVATTRIGRPALARAVCDALEQGSVALVAGPGYGKTMALDEALRSSSFRAVWVSCGQSAGEAGRLLLSVVSGIASAVPGAADVLAERLSVGAEPVDVRAATSGLLAELERLLVERLVIVFDDAEELDGDEASLALVDQFLASRNSRLSIAIATRRPLPLKVAKLRATGALTEFDSSQLCLTAAEAEELLRLRHGRAVSDDEVEGALAVTEGWPMGVALTALTGSAGPRDAAVPQAELFRYLAEEVLDALGPELRLALVDSSVPAVLTPAMADDLGLPAGFLSQIEQRGLFLRSAGSEEYVYHPLFRAFLQEQLADLRSQDEQAELHARAAANLVAAGQRIEAVEHFIAAADHEQALAVIGAHAQALLRAAPDTVSAWLERLPLRMRGEPMYLLLEARRQWGLGLHEPAVGPLRAAVSGFRIARNHHGEWLARLLLADALTSVGGYAFEEVGNLAQGWETGPGAAVAVAWYRVIALTALGRLEEAEALAARLRSDARTSAPFRSLDDIARVGSEPAAGRARDTFEHLQESVAELERGDPHGRLPYALMMSALVLRDLGENDAALAQLDYCEREAERAGMGFVARDCQLQRASLLAQKGDLSRAELELARAGQRRGAGWRGVHRGEAEAHVASLRGDSAEAVAAAQRALDRVAPGPVCYRVWCAVDMAPVLAANGAPDLARTAIDNALAALDERFPREHGRMHRARLLATRAYLEHSAGELEASSESIRWAFDEAGDEADQVVRAHWPALQPALWQALASGALTPENVLGPMQRAFPNGDALVAMVDHPEPGVRRAALATALAASHPAVLARLNELGEDEDAQVAAAAAATRERLRATPPPLRFELLGGFRVRRGGWELDDAAWERPMASRIVRFLLLQESAVPEDALFDAFWPDRPADAARQHLAVAVSRARKVLDLPGTEGSMIEVKERTYRLRLRERDSVDSADFRRAAAAALAEEGAARRTALEHAAALWTGEPLPEDRYSPWSFTRRERLAETYSHVLNALAETYEQSGDHHDALRVAKSLLEVDPLNEAAHRRLMLAYARTGRISHALRQYLECRRALVTELGVEPSTETSRLQARILAGDVAPAH
jgi:ATP/maltotriose-dependent transcriptional regulator MalT/DNA-binding SARP family transcriptional activator